MGQMGAHRAEAGSEAGAGVISEDRLTFEITLMVVDQPFGARVKEMLEEDFAS